MGAPRAGGGAARIMAVPFVFWTANPAAFLSHTLVGAFAFGLAVGTRPEPGPSIMASMTGPDTLRFGAEGAMADAHHVIGFMALIVVSLAAAEVAGALRYLLVPLGLALLVTPFVFGANTAARIAIGIALVVLGRRHGPVRERYGDWDARIV